MNLTKKRWLILVACCFVNLCLGSIYSWSVFAQSMAGYLSGLSGKTLTPGDLAIVYTIANSVGPITMITGGWFNDKFGPKKVILIGGLMFGGGMILSGFAASLNFLIFSYGIVAGLGLGMTYGCTISSCIKFFPDKRGLIGGITTAVYGLGSVIVSPLVTIIVAHSDATFAFKSIGLAFVILICGSSFFIQKCPSDFIPDGYTPHNASHAGRVVDKNWKEMLLTPSFYVMIILLTCGAFSGMMIISQASAVGVNMVGLSALAASTAVSFLALCNALGRIIAGYVSDRIGRINTLTVACILSVLGLISLYATGTGELATYYLGLGIVGICFGSFMGIFPGFTADQFGPKNNSVNFGIMFIGFAVSGYFGPTVMRNVFSTDGAYQRAFLISAAFSFAGVLFTLLFRFATRKEARHDS